MICSVTSRGFPDFIDAYVTGNYGEDIYKSRLICGRCGKVINKGDSYYMLDQSVYCMDCSLYAEACILDEVRGNYIYSY